MISNVISEEGYTPIANLTPEDRESIIQSLKKEGIWLAPHEVPTVPTIKSMFQSLSEGTPFHYIAQTIIHTLTRLTSAELETESYKFCEAPEHHPNISLYNYVYAAGAIHFHFDRHNLPIPSWVYRYQIYSHSLFSHETEYQYPHPILQLYGMDLPLHEIGMQDEEVAYDAHG